MSQKKGIIISGQSREIILAVDNYFEQERKESASALHKMTQLNSTRPALTSGVMVPNEVFDEVFAMLKKTNRKTERTVAATGISKNTLSRIRAEGVSAAATSSKIPTPMKGKRGPVIQVDIDALRTLIDNLRKDLKRNPSVKDILPEAQKQLNFKGQRTTLRRILNAQLGYKLKKDTEGDSKKENNMIGEEESECYDYDDYVREPEIKIEVE